MKTLPGHLLLSVLFCHSLAAAPFDAEAVRSGNWSDPASWKPAGVPGNGARVRIRPGIDLRYDLESAAVIRLLHVSGSLRFADDRDTELNVGLLKVAGGHAMDHKSGVEDVHGHARPKKGLSAALEVGRPGRPIPAAHSARIRLHYLEGMDREEEPAIICRPGGRMEFHGAPMARTWIKFGAPVKPGDRTITLEHLPEGWKQGDDILLTGSLHKDEFFSEERRIKAIDGKRITLDRAAEFEHFGEGAYRSEVANLSRNVIVESADPKGVRGHTMYHRHSAGSIAYARFAHLGKKDVLGRYAIHFHMVRDSMRGSTVTGAAIVDSHNRWVTIHSTEYLVVRDCVGYRSIGHGYFLEDGTEVYNVLDRNLGVQAMDGKRLPGQVLPFDPNDGAAFWWANARNTFTRNTACENETYGFRFDSQKRSNFDPTLPVRMPDGSKEKVDIRTLPHYRFQHNESHTEGLYSFAFAGVEGAGPDTRHPHVLRDLKAWQTHYAMRVQVPTLLMENVDIDHAVYGIYRPWFENHVYRNLRIAHTGAEPFNRGLDDRSSQHGSITVDGLHFEGGPGGRSMPLIQISANNLSGHAESHFRKVTIERGRSRAPLVNLGGGPRLKPETAQGVPVYLHDWFGPGRHAKVVSTRAEYWQAEGRDYGEVEGLTGDESRASEVRDIPFPELLDPVDDQPPATIITWPARGVPASLKDGVLVVRGVSTDNEHIQRVTVNGVEAKDLDYGFNRWEARLENVKPGTLKLVALAEDAAGNREQTPHRLTITVKN